MAAAPKSQSTKHRYHTVYPIWKRDGAPGQFTRGLFLRGVQDNAALSVLERNPAVGGGWSALLLNHTGFVPRPLRTADQLTDGLGGGGMVVGRTQRVTRGI
jgi:hypothetical protein